MTEIQVCVAYLHAVRARLVRRTTARTHPSSVRSEVGAGVAETVILVAIFAAGAIVIGGIIISKFTGKADSIPTGP